MSYIIRTRCPNGCKYKSGDTCIASKCPYQTGDVRYDIRLNAGDKPTKINAEVKQAVKEFVEKLEQAICDNTYPYFDKNGKPVNIWKTDGFDKIEELLKDFIKN